MTVSMERSRQSLCDQFRKVRQFSTTLAAPLAAEDMVVQTMPDVSPTKWHLAHTTWFFETFLLSDMLPDYQPYHPQYKYLFNSYYNAVGPQFSRPRRGMLSRPTVEEIVEYRTHVDRWMEETLLYKESIWDDTRLALLALGINHEQQHQELLLTDIKHVFGHNPLFPSYTKERASSVATEGMAFSWVSCLEDAGVHDIGVVASGFSFDNEGPRHAVYVRPYALANRLVTAGEYMAFIEDGGYTRPELWLSEGWSAVQEHGWRAPLYWSLDEGKWFHYTLQGYQLVDPLAPVCHVSLFEADAYARWCGKRLPSEAEWELAAEKQSIAGNFVEQGAFHPLAASGSSLQEPLYQLYGDVWEWTSSSYAPYPGFEAASGAVGEYNGKFMCSQMVLRGGSCATSLSHIRPTYRNFFYPASRWQFSGIRLADDL